jgi:RNA polymerase sigma-70 factor (ECF subfamily)
LLEEQDRSRWDRAEIEEGCALVHAALARARPDSYALEAAIAAVHAESASAEATDWAQIAGLYARLLELYPSPVVALNRAVAVAMAEGCEAGLELVEGLKQALDGYQWWHAARADLLRRLGRQCEAIASYQRAYALAHNAPELRFLARRLAELGAGLPEPLAVN